MGGAIITWYDSDIYAQRINATGHVQWNTNGIPICNVTGSQSYPKIVSDNANGAIIAWLDARNGTNDIYTQRIDENGTNYWADYGIPVCKETGSQYELQIVSDGVSGVIITWRDDRGADSDIYAQRVLSNGSIEWDDNGTTICAASNNQRVPQISSDSKAGAYITWMDQRSYYEIYAQRINATGQVQWASDGIGVCVGHSAYDPRITSTDEGSAIITWEDDRAIDDIYGQIINSSGHSLLDTNGIAIRVGSSTSRDISICSDGAGGAFMSWTDSDNIYAQHMKQVINIEPTSNHPNNITSSANGQESINWTLYDDWGPGKYRVWTNDSEGFYYEWKVWTDWENETNLQIDINRSRPGFYNYTIEYYDFDNLFGVPDTVFVNLTNNEPTVYSPPVDITTTANGTENI